MVRKLNTYMILVLLTVCTTSICRNVISGVILIVDIFLSHVTAFIHMYVCTLHLNIVYKVVYHQKNQSSNVFNIFMYIFT